MVQIQKFKRLMRKKYGFENVQHHERGSVIVIVTISLTILLGFCAIVTDVALLYAQKAQLQNSVDAAALAGVQELPSNPNDEEIMLFIMLP